MTDGHSCQKDEWLWLVGSMLKSIKIVKSKAGAKDGDCSVEDGGMKRFLEFLGGFDFLKWMDRGTSEQNSHYNALHW